MNVNITNGSIRQRYTLRSSSRAQAQGEKTSQGQGAPAKTTWENAGAVRKNLVRSIIQNMYIWKTAEKGGLGGVVHGS